MEKVLDIAEEIKATKHSLKVLFRKALLNRALSSATVGVGGAGVYYALSGDLSGSLNAAWMAGIGLTLMESVGPYIAYRDEMERVETLAKHAACFFSQADKPLSRPWPWNCLPSSSEGQKEEAQTDIPSLGL